jgi:transposase
VTGLARAALVQRVRQLATQGKLGLPRAGRADLGGAKQPFRANTRDVVRYWADEFVPWFRVQDGLGPLKDRTVIFDNASTHSPVKTQNATAVSMFHRLMAEWGLKGVVFLPPRSPSLNPVELCNAFLKHYVRKWAPDAGYTQAGLEAAIERALGKVTPQMVRNWVRGCGYGAPAAQAPPVRAPRAPLLLDANGTRVAQGGVDVHAQDRQHPAPPQGPVGPHRWPGYGPRPPGLVETRPAVCQDVVDPADDVFEPERIVDERVRGGATEYRVRWKGYAPSEDTWEPSSQFIVGGQQLLRDWRRRQQCPVTHCFGSARLSRQASSHSSQIS